MWLHYMLNERKWFYSRHRQQQHLTCVHRTIFTSYYEVVDISLGKSKTCHCYRLALLVLQLQCLLGLWQHVQVPRTQSPVRGHTYQVVGVLSAHHTQAVHRMLQQGHICLLLVSLQYWYNKHMLTWTFWSSRMQFCVLGWEVPVFSMDHEDEDTTMIVNVNVCSCHLILQHPIQEV